MFSILFLVTNGSRELTEGWCWWYRQPRANKHTITQLSCSRPLSQRYIPWYAASRKLSHNVRAIDSGGKFEPPPPRGVEGFFAEILKSQILQKRPIFLGIFLYIHILLFFFKFLFTFLLSTKKIDDFRKLASINSDLGHLIYPSIYLSIYLC